MLIGFCKEYIPLDLNHIHEEEREDSILESSHVKQDEEDDKSENEHHVGKDNSVYVVRICQ